MSEVIHWDIAPFHPSGELQALRPKPPAARNSPDELRGILSKLHREMRMRMADADGS